MKKVEIDEILMPGDEAENESRRQTVVKNFWAKLRQTANRIPFAEDMVAAYYCALDPETPTRVRGIILAALAYFIMPMDSIPDFLVGFGLTDDLTVLTVAYTAISSHLTDAHRAAARNALSEEPLTQE